MSLIKVVNKGGTGNRSSCPCGSWKKHWERRSKQAADFCMNADCQARVPKDQIDGGHVRKVDSTDQSEYILPLCPTCNHPTNTAKMTALEGLLVTARQDNDCGQ